MSRPIITVFPDTARNAWLARFENDPEVIRLFGFDTIQTAYTLLMPAVSVQRCLQERNPHCLVRVVDVDGTRPHPEHWPN
ncbi:hypothetical protein [uncultured Deinococcus sp.]|uniref:hypothetical protein n=1 Tax=uncultured Deinococcus sp. TaxID=158789 RepID=UPI0025E3C456|nr:hypothetical protein [uncultured Deinococcus sp.]